MLEVLDLRGQRFTVVGAAGFIGCRLLATLRLRGALVYAPSRDEPWPWNQPLGHVIYCAGLTADYLARPFDTVQAHVTLFAQIMQQGQWDSLVYLSSTRLYDALDTDIAYENSVLSLSPENPRHIYDFSKGLGESLCYVAGQGRAKIARLACVYEGPQDADGFLPALLRQAQAAYCAGLTQIEVSSSANFVRDYIHIDDVVDALIRIALYAEQTTYNVASGVNVSNAALFEYIHHRWGCRVIPLLDIVPSPVPKVSIRRLCDELHWQPKYLFDVLNNYIV